MRALSRAQDLRRDPLTVLLDAQRHGLVVPLTDGVPVFSRGRGTAGCVAVFGRLAVDPVLADPGLFGPAGTVADRDRLDAASTNLSTGLFSMDMSRHAERRQLFAPLFAQLPVHHRGAEITAGALADGVRSGLAAWRPVGPADLLAGMRLLARHGLAGLLLGCEHVDGDVISTAHDLLLLRRARRRDATCEWRRPGCIRPGPLTPFVGLLVAAVRTAPIKP